MVRFAFFFFFEFRLELAVSPDTARVGANQPNLAQFGQSLSRVGSSRYKKKKAGRSIDPRVAASLTCRRVKPHWMRVQHGFFRVHASQFYTCTHH